MMSEDPQNSQDFPVPPDEPASSGEPGFRPEPSPAQPAGDQTLLPEEEQPNSQPPEPPRDYVSEIRKSLLNEEISKASRGTGGLFRRITSSLRRVTGPLRNTGALRDAQDKEREPDSPPTPQPAEIGDDFLTDRLGGATVGEAPLSPLPDNLEETPDFDGEMVQFQPVEEEEQAPLPQFDLEPEVEDDAPISLLDSGAIAALGMAEETAQQEAEPDWMKEIREEAAREAADRAAADETPGPGGATGQLRNFISGILGRSGEKRRPAEETPIPDDLVTGRLERSLGTGTGENEAANPAEISSLEGMDSDDSLDNQLASLFGETAAPTEGEIYDAGGTDDPSALLGGLEVSFGQVGDEGAGEGANPYQLYPEDEALLWGNANQPSAEEPAAPEITFTPEELWGEKPDTLGFGSDLRREIWGEAIQPDTPAPETFQPGDIDRPVVDDAYAATLLTGEDYETQEAAPESDELLSQALDKSSQTDLPMSAQDLRSIALEDYEGGWKIDWGDEEQAPTPETAPGEEEPAQEQAEEAAASAAAEAEAKPATDWKTWLAALKPGQKLLLAEAVLAAVALIIAVPFFTIMIIRGSQKPVAAVAVNALPAGLPYPTGMSLPGGWYFALAKSTFTNGQWQPVTSEWLEGTELRRVVALPWNPQTEAVIKSFQAGDPVELYLSNNDIARYKVASVERVPVSNTQIYSDQKPSLVIILYQQKDTSRWVVICRP